MAELDRLEVRLEADLSQFRRELQKAERAARSATANMGRQFAALDRATEPAKNGLKSLRQAASQFEESTLSAGSGQRIADLSSAARGLGSAFASAFEGAAVGGRKLSGILRGLQSDVLRVLTRQLVTQPLTGAILSLLGGGQEGGLGGGLFASLFHGGGVVGAGAAPGRFVPSSLFEAAPKFAGGGVIGLQPRLGPNEVPAILHRGETVRTSAQEAALSQRDVSGVTFGPGAIVIQTPNPGAFAESRGQIEAMLADAVRRGRRNR
jgi:hypothetical protein